MQRQSNKRKTAWNSLVWIGAALSALGLLGIFYSVVLVRRARKAAQGDDDLRDRLQRVLPWNLGSLFLSMLGLMMVVVGVILA